MKLFGILALAGSKAETPCSANNESDCLTGQACAWDGLKCQVDMMSTFNYLNAQSSLGAAFTGMENTSSDSRGAGLMDFSAMAALGAAGAAVMSQSNMLQGFQLDSWLPYSQNNFMQQTMSPGGFFGNQLTNQYFQCPLDVPFCSRQACDGGDESNAYNCYATPGCCFDQNLFLHKQMFGASYYKSVPVCYRAIDNPLFGQLSAEVSKSTPFNPAYLGPIVNKVLGFVQSPYTYPALKNYMQCAPSGKSFESWQFISKLKTKFPQQGNTIQFMMMKENYFDDLVCTLTPSCGWSEINENECVLSGCCWNEKKSSCQAALDFDAMTAVQIDAAINHLNFLQFSESQQAAPAPAPVEADGAERAVNFNTIGAVQAMNQGGINDPMNAALFSGQSMNDIMKYQAFSQGAMNPQMMQYNAMTNNPMNFATAAGNTGMNLAQMANLQHVTSRQTPSYGQNMADNIAAQALGINPNNLWLIQGNQGPGKVASTATDYGLGYSDNSDSSNGFNDYFRYQALTGGSMDFKQPFFGGDLSNSKCPAPEVSINCMPPSNTQFNDFMGIHRDESMCNAKGCCFDKERQKHNALGLTRYTCPWNPEWSIYQKFSFLPNMSTSLRGCCKLSACVHPTERDTENTSESAALPIMAQTVSEPKSQPVINPYNPRIPIPSNLGLNWGK